MATQFEQRPPIEGQAGIEAEGAEGERSAGAPLPPARSVRRRMAGLMVAGLTVGLALTTIVVRLTAARGRQRMSGRRRRALMDVQPRVAIFAPTVTISLPFSGITGHVPPGFIRAGRAGPFARRRLGVQRRGHRLMR